MLEQSIARAVEVARGAGLDTRVIRAEIRGARVVVEMPLHVAWVALTAEATARLAIERMVLQALAGRLPVLIPSSIVHRDQLCVRTRLSGRSGLEHHRRAMDDQAVGEAWARELGMLFAAVQTARSANASSTAGGYAPPRSTTEPSERSPKPAPWPRARSRMPRGSNESAKHDEGQQTGPSYESD